MQEKKELIALIDKIGIFILGFFLVLFPLVFSPSTTDPFSLPKQILLAIGTIFIFILFGAKLTIQGSVRIRRTPFDLPILLFTLAVLGSALFSLNRMDSLMTFIPFLMSVFLFFAVTNNIKTQKNISFLAISLLAGSVITSLITVLSYFKIYVLPLDIARAQSFTTMGSLFDQAIYLLISLSLAIYLLIPIIRTKKFENGIQIFTPVAALIIVTGFIISILGVFKFQQGVILPYDTGIQIAFAAISQDTGRIIQGLLFGSGFGNFLSDFTRFKQAAFNANANLWSISFFRSSSFFLELIATTGILGAATFIFLSYRVLKTKPLFIPGLVVIVLAFILPFSITTIALLFVTLGIFAAIQGLNSSEKDRFFDVDIHLVAFKQGIFALSEPGEHKGRVSKILPAGVLVLILVLSLVVGYYYATFTLSDITFQSSFIAAANNNGNKAYDDETKAISYFSQRDGYHRIFSQLNLNLANSIASSLPKGSSPSAQTQQTIYTLIQQSINSARTATTISPLTVTNWQNLASVYRSLIGFGQNADTFAILANQQAIALDPNNPQEYINLGGIFYQLGQWDNATQQFQIAVNLKPDLPNGYYNLGHALEQKGDLKGALAQYNSVKTLVANDKANLDKIQGEIDALQKRIDEGSSQAAQGSNEGSNLNVNQPNVQLPAQNPPVKIPAPSTVPVPTPSESPKASSTPQATPTPTPSPTANP